MVPRNIEDRIGIYERWYVVDFSKVGLSFFELCEASHLPKELEIDPLLSGDVSVISDGDAELGTGTGELIIYKPTDPQSPARYSKEVFADGSTLYFEMCPLKQDISVSTPRLEKTAPRPI